MSINESIFLSKLKRVTDWHTLGIHLDIPSYELDKIRQQFLAAEGVERCKSEMVHLWLKTTVNASWADVAVALEKLNEIVLANEVRKICSPGIPGADSNVKLEDLPVEEVNVEFKKAEVKKFTKIENRFASLVNNVKVTLVEKKISPIKLHGFLEERLRQKLVLSENATIRDIFNSIAPYYSFLNTSLLESIIDEFLEEEASLQRQLDSYEGELEEFASTTKLILLKEINSTKQHEGMPLVVLKLAGCCLDVTIERFQLLVKHIFGKQSNALSDIRVEDGCICISWITQESAVDLLVSLANINLYFMKHVGILRLTIGNVTVIDIEDKEELNDINYVLITAVAAECFNAVKFLLNAGASVNSRAENGSTPLVVASLILSGKITELLCKANADLNLPDTRGLTPLMWACHCARGAGDAHIIELLLQSGANPNVGTSSGQTALLSIEFDDSHLEIVRSLLEAGATINHQDEDGLTALMLACRSGCYEIVHLLLQYKADVELTMVRGTTALMIACMNDGSTGKHEQIVSLLLNSQANANAQDSVGYTALMLACRQQFTQAVSLLLASGAETNLQSEDGWTALMVACNTEETSFPDHSIPLLLLSKGAGTETRNSYGSTALLVATKSMNQSAVRALLNAEAQINAQDQTGRTALHLSTVLGLQAITEHLLSAGADVSIADLSGNTPISIAKQMSFNHYQIYQLLFKHAVQTLPMSPEEEASAELSLLSDFDED